MGIPLTIMVTFQAAGRAVKSMIVNLGRQCIFDIPLLAIFNHFWQLTGLMYVPMTAGLLTTLVAALIGIPLLWGLGKQEESNARLCIDIPAEWLFLWKCIKYIRKIEVGEVMNSQKIENLLNLALDVSGEERGKSLGLDTGYDETGNRWEVIVKYNGDLRRLDSSVISVEELIAGYAIVTLPQNLIESFAELEEVEYMEMPKRLYFAIQQGKDISCIPPVTTRNPYLSGRGTIVAVIDSGERVIIMSS